MNRNRDRLPVPLPVLVAAFTCPRTCPLVSARWCRFRPVLDALGPVKVNSHTATVKIDLSDAAALQRAVEVIGGQWIGAGTHQLFSSRHTGNAFKLPGWNYPCVVDAATGEVHYDNYGGAWGDVAQLEKLKAEYSAAVVEQRANVQGWQTERTGDGGVIVYHPTGGTLTVSPGGQLDAAGFIGNGCHEAREQLGLPVEEVQNKPEYSQIKAENRQPGS